MIGERHPRNVLGLVLAGGLLGAVTCALPEGLPAALAVLLALAVPVLVVVSLTAPPDEARILLTLFGVAVSVRVGVALVVHYGLGTELFSLDHRLYQIYGLQFAEHWAGLGPPPEHLLDRAGYYLWNAALYTLVGFVPLAPTLANAVVAGLSALLAYTITREIAGPRAALYAGLFAALFPSLVLWSSLNLKDAAAILTILMAIRGAQLLQRRISPAGAALLCGGLLGLAQIRHYLVVLVLISVGAALLLPRLRNLPAALSVWGALCIGALLFPGTVEGLSAEASFESLDEYRRNLALGESAYHGDADVSTAGAALRFLPVGLAYFLLAPAPWQLLNPRQWLTLPEMLVWYALLPQVYFGARHALRGRAIAALPVVTFALLATISYALVEANLGTAYRHRAQVLILYLVFAAVGIATRPDRVRAPRLAEARA